MKNLLRIDHQRGFAIALIILQAAALAIFCQTWIVSTIIIALTTFSALTNARWFTTVVSSRFPLIFPLAFVLHKTILPSSFTTSGNSAFIPDASLVATYFLVYQLATLFAIYEKDRLPHFLPILAITGTIFAGDVRVSGAAGRSVFQVMSLLLVVFSIGFYVKARRPILPARRYTRGHVRWLMGLGTLCCVIAWTSSVGIYRYSREIESVLSRVAYPQLRPNSVGFSGSGRIGSVAQQKNNQGKSVALRVFADSSPGYLRGKVFDRYSRGQWQRDSQTKPFVPSRTLGADQTEPLEIWPVQAFREVLFTPLGVTKVDAPVGELLVDNFGVLTGEELQSMSPYTVWRPFANPYLAADQSGQPPAAIERLTTLPDDMDPRIHELAKTIVGDAIVTEDKIAAVENFFLDNYEYQFGIDVPADVDPIEYFLLNQPPGHCEFFASGAIMLLRSVDVPCRYVTGFVAVEPNNIGDYWVARNRDAHAWVEAYVPELGWVIVEPTPASGVPQSSKSNQTNQAIDAARSWWQQFVASIRSGRARELLASWLGWLLLPVSAIALAAIIPVAWRRLRRKRVPKNGSLDPKMERLQILLQQMDDLWHRDGLPRDAHETLDQFAHRLQAASAELHSGTRREQAATWYRRFASARYSGQMSDEVIDQLAQAHRRVCHEGSS